MEMFFLDFFLIDEKLSSDFFKFLFSSFHFFLSEKNIEFLIHFMLLYLFTPTFVIDFHQTYLFILVFFSPKKKILCTQKSYAMNESVKEHNKKK